MDFYAIYDYSSIMDSIQKFYSDIEKAKKHYRANHQNYDGNAVCQEIADLFCRNNKGIVSLADSFAGYWIDTYIRSSLNINEEPTPENIDKICAFQALLDGQPEQRDIACLTQEDYKELCSLVNMEAEDLPLDILNDMMTIFVDKQAY